jgi:ABC-2 type transport system permease protein
LKTQRYTTWAEGVAALRRGEVDAVVVVPMTLDGDLRSGGTTRIPVLVSGAVQSSQAAVTAVTSVVARQGATAQAARFATTHSTRNFEQNLAATRSLQRETPVVPVRTEVVNSKSNLLPLGYNYSAPTMPVLFVFINALAGGAVMTQARRFGIFARALAAPIRPRDLVLGETLCCLTLALGQALLVVVVGAVMLGVSWGDPLAVAALIGMWALVGTGAGIVSGTLFRTPEQATAIGPAVGIVFGMLGRGYVAAGDRPPVSAPGRACHAPGVGGGRLGDRVVTQWRPGRHRWIPRDPRRVHSGAVRLRILSPSSIACHA